MNLSGRTQAAEFDLSQFGGCRPTDVFGGSPFPEIGKTAYRLTFSPYGYYIFNIKYEQRVEEVRADARDPPKLEARKKLVDIFSWEIERAPGI